MKKLILKTAIITLLAVIASAAFVFAILSIYSPVSVAKVLDGFSAKNAAVVYYEKQYEKTDSAEDLLILCKKIDVYSEPLKASGYLGTFIADEKFEELCETDKYGEKMKEFYYGNYVISLYLAYDSLKAAKSAYEICEKQYTEGNAFSVLLSDDRLTITLADALNIRRQMIRLGIGNGEREYYNRDYQTVSELITELEKAEATAENA